MSDRLKTPFLGLCVLVLAWAGLSCGGSGATGSPGPQPGPSNPGGMNVRLVDAPTADFKEIDLDIQKVEIHQSAAAGVTDAGWITLGTPDKVVNLLSLQGGVVETLVAGAGLPPGTYQQLRLILGGNNSVVLQDGTREPLKVPSGLQTGIKIPGSFTVAAGTTADVFIDFDGAGSIQIHQTGNGRTWILRPVVRGFDRAVTGSISGTLTVAGGGPLAGAEVMAETVSGGTGTVVRSAFTDATGAYTLDLLPLGQSYVVVSMPRAGGVAYQAQASGALALGTAAPVLTFSAAFQPAAATGSIGGSVTPPGGQADHDTAFLYAAFGSQWLVAARASLASGSPETYAFAAIPAGNYRIQGLRSTLNTDGSTTETWSGFSPALQVLLNVALSQNLTL